MHQEEVTSERSQAYPEYTLEDRFEVNAMGASQIGVTNWEHRAMQCV